MQEECDRLRGDFESTNSSLTTTREALAREEGKNGELSKERDELNKKLSSSLTVANEFELVIKNLENDKESLNELLNKKIAELEQITKELHELQAEATETRRLKGDALTQLEEVRSEKALLAVG